MVRPFRHQLSPAIFQSLTLLDGRRPDVIDNPLSGLHALILDDVSERDAVKGHAVFDGQPFVVTIPLLDEAKITDEERLAVGPVRTGKLFEQLGVCLAFMEGLCAERRIVRLGNPRILLPDGKPLQNPAFGLALDASGFAWVQPRGLLGEELPSHLVMPEQRHVVVALGEAKAPVLSLIADVPQHDRRQNAKKIVVDGFGYAMFIAVLHRGEVGRAEFKGLSHSFRLSSSSVVVQLFVLTVMLQCVRRFCGRSAFQFLFSILDSLANAMSGLLCAFAE